MADLLRHRLSEVGLGGADAGSILLDSGRTLADKLDETISVKDFGAVADGATDAAAAFAAAFAASAGEVLVPPGTYALSALVVPGNKRLKLQRGARLVITTTTASIDVKGEIVAQDLAFGAPGKIGSLGDSRSTGGGVSFASSPQYKKLKSVVNWIEVLTKGAIFVDALHNQGIGGSNTASLLSTQIPNFIADGAPYPRYCFILCGANDAIGAATWEKQVTDVVNTWLWLLSLGSLPIQCANIPQSIATYGASIAQRTAAFNRFLRNLAPRFGIPFIDIVADLTDPASKTGEILASHYEPDGIHENGLGTYIIAKRFVERYGDRLDPNPYLLGHQGSRTGADSYHATYNRFGNFVPNPMFLGTGGGAWGNITGTFPDDFVQAGAWGDMRMRRLNTGANPFTATAALEPRTDGMPGQWLVITRTDNDDAGANDAFYELSIPVPSSGLLVGDVIGASMDFSTIVTAGITFPWLQIACIGASPAMDQWVGHFENGGIGGTVPPASATGRLIAEPFAIPSGTTSIRVRFMAKWWGTGRGTIKLANPFFGLIPS